MRPCENDIPDVGLEERGRGGGWERSLILSTIKNIFKNEKKITSWKPEKK